MSFRDLRNFCEIMRSLGYGRPISMENFRSPNFELVADLTDWLLHRFNAHAPDDISTEPQRVTFITEATRLIHEKTGIKVNPRKLYGADGYAVKELLRVAQMLYEAQKFQGKNVAVDSMETGNFALNSKLHDLKSTRSLCSSIVESGATLHDLLHKEQNNREERIKALRFLEGISRNLDSNSEQEVVERSVQSLLSSHADKLSNLQKLVDDLQRDEKSLDGKIKKKKTELERCHNRLSQLHGVRPVFMDEYEKLEEELAKVYDSYVARFRNLDYLEYELDQLNREEQERMEENARELKALQKRLREEEWRMLRGEEESGGNTNMGGMSMNSQWNPMGGPMAGANNMGGNINMGGMGGPGGPMGGPMGGAPNNRGGMNNNMGMGGGMGNNTGMMGDGASGKGRPNRPQNPVAAKNQGAKNQNQVVGSMVAISDGSSDDGSSEAISVGKSDSSDHPISISGSDDILEQSGSSEDISMIGRGNDHNF